MQHFLVDSWKLSITPSSEVLIYQQFHIKLERANIKETESLTAIVVQDCTETGHRIRISEVLMDTATAKPAAEIEMSHSVTAYQIQLRDWIQSFHHIP